jgi:tRNA G10  N-methylase Trm11
VKSNGKTTTSIGRWPANFIHDGLEEEWSKYFYCAKANKKDRNEGVNIWQKQDLKLELMEINQLIKDTSEDILMENSVWNTIMFGNNITEQYQKDLTFIISMVLKLITDWKIYNVSQNLNIKEYIQDVSKQFQENGLNLVENAEQIKILKQNTTGEKMELVLGVSLVVLKMLLKIKEIENRTSTHPTVKPTELMRYLCRLITPKNGTVLDPFMGSGSTGKAAILEGFSFIGVELSEEYLEIAKNRIKLFLLLKNANDKTS